MMTHGILPVSYTHLDVYKRQVTFLEYVNQVRINHIHEELLATEDSITDILEHNGFTNYKVFSRMFKAQFGMTPRELRKLQEN